METPSDLPVVVAPGDLAGGNTGASGTYLAYDVTRWTSPPDQCTWLGAKR